MGYVNKLIEENKHLIFKSHSRKCARSWFEYIQRKGRDNECGRMMKKALEDMHDLESRVADASREERS